MTLWFAFAVMTAAAIFAVLWPLGRRKHARSGSGVAVYRDQLDEIERDRGAGLIAARDADAARVEVSRRLLAASDAEQAPLAAGPSALWLRRAAALVALVLLPAVAITLYVVLGAPNLANDVTGTRAQAPADARSVASLVSQVEAHIERNPNDGRGWEVIAPVYLRMGRVDDAVKARRRALELNGASADREAELGEALVAAGNGVITTDAKAAFDRALGIDSQHLKARFYLGVAAEQDGKKDEAADIWRGMLANAPPDAPWTGNVREALARVSEKSAPGPDADAVAAASKLSDSERAEMVRGMVAGLAERLARDGSDVEGWLRLMRSYIVLGEPEKAKAAAADARRALANDNDKLRRVDDLARNLGLEG